jgi:hypothetical protein
MRNVQNNKRMRGRNNNNHNNNNNHRKNQNPMSRVFESNGPDVKIRGTPSHIAEKYVQLARDAHTSGDPVSAENYYQHAEHYFRLIAAAQEQFRQNNPHLPRPDNDTREESFDDEGDDEFGQQPMSNAGNAPFGTREPQPFLPPEAQPYPQNQPHVPRPHQQQGGGHDGGGQQDRQQGDRQPHVDRLPSFITGGQQPAGPQAQPPQPPGFNNQQGPNNQNGHDGQPDRFPLHRRRRRHRGPPRPDMAGAAAVSDDSGDAPRGE